jgi:MbtH protein
VTVEREEPSAFKVVVNDDGQYALWPAERDLPLGWAEGGMEGSKPDCLAYVESVWTDMTPRRLAAQRSRSVSD